MKEDIEGKKVLVVGVAKSGISAAKLLTKHGCEVILNDIKNEDELKEILNLIDFKVDLRLGVKPDEFVAISDFIVLSPGVPSDLEFVNIAKKQGIKVISEVELAYLFCEANIIGITGTNGKTTTTTLIGEIFKAFGKNTFVVGNIGLPITSEVEKAKKDDVIVAELSSFQLETIEKFKPKVSLILNFTPDHLNRHKTYENYIAAKCRIFENQNQDDFLVLNYDDEGVRAVKENAKAQIFYFTKGQDVARGAFCKAGKVYIRDNGEEKYIIDEDDIYIPGKHNLENALAAICSAYIIGVSIEVIRNTLKEFKGVEHRIEFVDEVNGVRYINDSKGTNVDAAIKAVEAMKSPTVIIAGGYDKGVEFDEFIKSLKDKVYHMILIGQTADKIKATAEKYGFKSITKVNDMNEAILTASKIAKNGENVLLSPACASWGMFKNFEQRGEIFKEEVKKLRG